MNRNWEDTDNETKNNLEDLFNNFQSDKINIIELNLEIVNVSNQSIDISGYEFYDATNLNALINMTN